MRIGVDIGGTKIEAAAIDERGDVVFRTRAPTPQRYEAVLETVSGLVGDVEAGTGTPDGIGVCIPGSSSPADGRIFNANLLCLNGQAFGTDLARRLDRKVRLANDANCFAISEAVDGAAAGHKRVFGAILGTGCGGGFAVDGEAAGGPNGLAGEWGHIPLPWPESGETQQPPCWCGRVGCLETWISGSGLERDFATRTGRSLNAVDIVDRARQRHSEARDSVNAYADRLARGLAMVVNVLDPDAIVLGGGLSNINELYADLPRLIPRYVFGGKWQAPILRAKWGDSSGVRGAARLWRLHEIRVLA